jgi:hypothetical protein
LADPRPSPVQIVVAIRDDVTKQPVSDVMQSVDKCWRETRNELLKQLTGEALARASQDDQG